ncbi:MAG: hypothetical protein IKV57_02175 [Clostridia bacterium]|nr:hypothetical protein [Clostridia bacterium]
MLFLEINEISGVALEWKKMENTWAFQGRLPTEIEKWERMSGNAFLGGKERKKGKPGMGNGRKSAKAVETGEK